MKKRFKNLSIQDQLIKLSEEKKWHNGIINSHTDKLREIEQQESELLKKLSHE